MRPVFYQWFWASSQVKKFNIHFPHYSSMLKDKHVKININCRNISSKKYVWNVQFKYHSFKLIYFCMFCESHSYSLAINHTENEHYTIRWSFPPPQTAWIASFSASVEQRGSMEGHFLGMLLFLGVAKQLLPSGCSATIQNAAFLHLFPRQLAFKGAALVIDCLPLTSTLLVLENCLNQLVTHRRFIAADSGCCRRIINVGCKLHGILSSWVEQQEEESIHFNSGKYFHGLIGVIFCVCGWNEQPYINQLSNRTTGSCSYCHVPVQPPQHQIKMEPPNMNERTFSPPFPSTQSLMSQSGNPSHVLYSWLWWKLVTNRWNQPSTNNGISPQNSSTGLASGYFKQGDL